MDQRTPGQVVRSALLLACFAGVVFAQNGAEASAQATLTPGAAAAPTPVSVNVAMTQGMAALKADQARRALTDFQQVLQADPNNTAANLLASTAAVETFQGQLAVQYAEKAKQLDPKNWKIHTTLVAAYSAAGMTKQRDEERALLRELHQNGPPDARLATGFLLEMFPVGAYRVDAVDYFEPMGRFHTYYRFLVRRADGKRVWEVDVESDDFDQKSWAAANPAEAAGGNRQFQITGHGDEGSNPVDYRMFSGRPDYDNIRVMVVEILRSRGVPGAPASGR